jgi:hypothetical protein
MGISSVVSLTKAGLAMPEAPKVIRFDIQCSSHALHVLELLKYLSQILV